MAGGEDLVARIRGDMAAAMKRRETDLVLVLRSMLAAVDNATSQRHRSQLDNDLVVTILRGEAAELSAAIAEFQRAGTTDRADDLTRQLAIVVGYLPT